MSNPTEIAERARAEIEALHVFLEAWLAGTMPNDAGAYENEFLARFDPDFNMVQPGGARLLHRGISEGIRTAHGASPGFRIRIRNVRIHAASGDLVVADYEEHQRGARNAPSPENARISTVIFRRDDSAPLGLLWLHLHETWMPEEERAAIDLDF